MSLFSVFSIAGTGLSAESVRLNTTASNLANANSVSSSIGTTYRAREPVFAPLLDAAPGATPGLAQSTVGVRVLGIVQSQRPLRRDYEPNNPAANAKGYVYRSNVNVMEELANMISASRSYQNDVQVMDASKQMLLQTLSLGK